MIVSCHVCQSCRLVCLVQGSCRLPFCWGGAAAGGVSGSRVVSGLGGCGGFCISCLLFPCWCPGVVGGVGVGVGRCSWRLLLWVFDVWYRSVLVGAYMGVLFLDSRVPQLFRVFTIQMVYSGFHCLWEATCVGVHRTHSLPWHCTV